MCDIENPLYLIDGSLFLYRAFHALPYFETKNGFPTQAIYGFTTMILKLLNEKKPRFLSVVFDAKGPTLRHAQLSTYKANRPPMPEDLSSQIPLIKEILTYLGIPQCEKEGYEADDILATFAWKGERWFPEVYILTSDKDILQIVDEGIKVMNPFKKGEIYNREKIIEKFGFPPELIPDYLSLTGDSSDNIPGVPGIGEKTARKLIREWGNIEKIFLNCDKIGKSIRDKLIPNRKLVERNLSLIKLVILPLEVKKEFFEVGKPDVEKLKNIFQQLEFKKLLPRLKEVQPTLF
ncbi:MAG: 5'-3' exonuclease [Caldiserica bacterium]|nr:5'-3' exonuclease [Caldisericota bacterium]